jgi:hypothetical protein
MAPKLYSRVVDLPVSPLCDIEVPIERWTPGKRGGNDNKEEGSKFLRYIKSKNPGLAPAGWRDITPYFGKVWPKSISGWRTSAAMGGYYISVTKITKVRDDGTTYTYRCILVCLNPTNGP